MLSELIHQAILQKVLEADLSSFLQLSPGYLVHLVH